MSPARRKRVTSGVPFEQAVGYSRAVAAGEFIFVSGCTSISHGKVVYEGDLARQTEQALLNVSAALEQFGASLADVVQTRLYVTDISRWEEVGEAHRMAFELAPPATSMVQVAALIDPRLLVEVEAVAHREGGLDADEDEPDDSDLPADAIRLDDPSLRDAGDPVELAARYDAEGADELTFLDITASSGGRATMYDVVRRTAEQVFIPLTVGGGVRSTADVDALLRAGADKVGLNTAAVARPELLAEAARQFGAQCVVLSVDARRVRAGSPPTPSGFEVTTHGGRQGTGIDAVQWARRATDLGAGEILLNSMDADGTTAGFDTELIALVRAAVSVPVIASGGAGTLAHFPPAIDAGADAVLAASVFHFGTLRIGEVKQTLRAAGYPVR
jgi:cyclase